MLPDVHARRKSQDAALEREFKDVMGISEKKSTFTNSFLTPRIYPEEHQRSLFCA